MNVLTRFELRKIMRRKSFAVGVAILLLGSMMLVFASVSGENWTDEHGEGLTGLPAIALAKRQTHAEAGLLTKEKIAAAIQRYHEVRSDKSHLITSGNGSDGDLTNTAYGKFEQKDYQLLSLIREAYSPSSGYDYYVVAKLGAKDASAFYQKRLEKVDDYLNTDYTYGNYSAADKDFYKSLNSRVSEPFHFDYAGGWKNVLLNLWLIIFAAAILICICLSPVFAGEYQSGADAIILCTRYGRSRVIGAKLKASLIVTTGLFTAGVLFFTVLMLAIYGLYGWNSSLQIIQFRAPFPLTILETYLFSVLLGYLACLMVMAITLALSSRMKTPFAAIIVSSLVLFLPLFIPYSKDSRLFNHAINLFPVKMMNGFSSLSHYELYHLFGTRMPEPYALAGMAVITAIVLLPLAYRSFKQHQVA